MMAASLFLVLLAAKFAMVAGNDVALSAWSPLAYLWQDVVVALVFFAFERLVRRPLAIRVVYGALVAYAAFNVPIARVLSTPLTAPMLRAARGTLADSIGYHVTPTNIALVIFVLALGAGLPFLLKSVRMRDSLKPVRAAIACALIVVLAGGFASRRVDTRGMDRSPLLALVRTSFPRIRGEAADQDWRSSPSASTKSAELSGLKGAAAGRNVVLVVLESTAAQYLRTYGAAEDPMPNLTALAKRSIVFDNAYAVYPESVKGLVALLASRYPAFDVPAERHAPLMRTSVATTLAAAGYNTALFHSGRFFYLGMDTLVFSAGFKRAVDAGDIGGNHNSSFGIDEASAVSAVLQWIDREPRERPFFVTYLPIAGHHPYAYNIAPRFSGRGEIDSYRNALYESDAALGQLLAGLRDRGLDRSTVIVVIGDHGEAFWQHPGNYGHSLALYDENVRVPFLIALPSGGQATRVERPVSAIDVAPTILDLVGVDRPDAFEGSSVLNGEANMALFFADYSMGLLGVRDGCLKLIHEVESRRSKLFDVCADAAEKEDLADQRPERMKFYRERLEAWSAAQVWGLLSKVKS